jgi:ABC-type multidrug transport system permease subunit
MYLVGVPRPDISYAMSKLSRFTSNLKKIYHRKDLFVFVFVCLLIICGFVFAFVCLLVSRKWKEIVDDRMRLHVVTIVRSS